jgi:hypothetical protein
MGCGKGEEQEEQTVNLYPADLPAAPFARQSLHFGFLRSSRALGCEILEHDVLASSDFSASGSSVYPATAIGKAYLAYSDSSHNN